MLVIQTSRPLQCHCLPAYKQLKWPLERKICANMNFLRQCFGKLFGGFLTAPLSTWKKTCCWRSENDNTAWKWCRPTHNAHWMAGLWLVIECGWIVSQRWTEHHNQPENKKHSPQFRGLSTKHPWQCPCPHQRLLLYSASCREKFTSDRK